jgi:uncharacterized protein (TIGR02646 family)
MIHVGRDTVERPKSLTSRAADDARSEAARFFSQNSKARHQKAFEFKPLWTGDDIRQALTELFRGKCAYCETTVVLRDFTNIDHFRPKSGALSLDGSASPDHYWWLAYEWANLYLVCQACNAMKARRFPVKSERAKAPATSDALSSEEALLLDPCLDNPSEHLVFLDSGQVVGLTKRGSVSIEVYGLNRSALVAARREQAAAALTEFSTRSKWFFSAKRFESAVARALDPALEYLAVRRQALGRLKGRTSHPGILQKYITDAHMVVSRRVQKQTLATFQQTKKQEGGYSIEDEIKDAHATAYYTGAKRIEQIEIRNFKAIASLRLAFPQPRSGHEPWLMLIGENGTGKSSILQAVALALMGEKHANSLGLNASQFVRNGASEGSVIVRLTNLEPMELKFRAGSSRFTVNPREPKVLLLGYGATRLFARTENVAEAAAPVSIKNLFNPTAPLSDVEPWFANRSLVSKERFEQVAVALKRLLMLDREDLISRGRGKIEARVFGTRLPVRQLSDGFQSVLALALDIMLTMFQRWPSMQDAEGIVLLDEIEVHLHPRWKIELVKRLRNVFPRVAFLATTHDPLCLRGLNRKEIVVLRRDENHQVTALQGVPPIDELRADQVLTSLFGLTSTRGDKTNAMIAKYSRLLNKRRDAREQQTFERLREKLQGIMVTGETPLQRRVEHALHKTLEEMIGGKRKARPELQRVELPEQLQIEAKRQLGELLNLGRDVP